MATIEVLLTLGEGQGIDYARLAEKGFDTGGRTGFLCWEDVHKTMTGLPPEQQAILYLRPNLPRAWKYLPSLTNHLWLALIGFEAQKLSRYEGELTDAIRSLLLDGDAARDARQARTVKVALAEYEDGKLCHACKGSREPGKVAAKAEGVIGLIYTTCQACDGRTWNPWSDNQRANLVGGTRSHWRERHEPGYLHVLDECTALYREGAKAFKERLFGPAPLESTLQRRA